MNRDQLRERIDTMERLHSLMSAIDDLSTSELKPGETVTVTLSEHRGQAQCICSAYDLPPILVMAGLRAMVCELELQLRNSELAASDDLQRATSLRREASHG